MKNSDGGISNRISHRRVSLSCIMCPISSGENFSDYAFANNCHPQKIKYSEGLYEGELAERGQNPDPCGRLIHIHQ